MRRARHRIAQHRRAGAQHRVRLGGAEIEAHRQAERVDHDALRAQRDRSGRRTQHRIRLERHRALDFIDLAARAIERLEVHDVPSHPVAAHHHEHEGATERFDVYRTRDAADLSVDNRSDLVQRSERHALDLGGHHHVVLIGVVVHFPRGIRAAATSPGSDAAVGGASDSAPASNASIGPTGPISV